MTSEDFGEVSERGWGRRQAMQGMIDEEGDLLWAQG